MIRYLRPIVVLFAVVASMRAAERPLAIDFEQSRVDIAVHASMDSFVGKLTHFDPVVTVGGDGQVVGARFSFNFVDLVTGKPKRDKAMHEWQQTAKFPDGRFVLDSLQAAVPPASGQVAAGRLTLHGVTREIRFPVTIVNKEGQLLIDGDATIDTREFGLPIIRMMGVLKVDPVLHVRFHLQGRSNS